ncbi:hypothetical protein [Caulobacter sp. LjRoot300]|uniref:hypothetical protein n=1 Tax=Caulobacter sp. LjRoot300 TaxID=3342321 RepID=UPI003ED12DAE
MMDQALKTHKETTFGWVLLVQEWIAARKVRLARLASEQAAQAMREARAKPGRHLAPR